MSYSRKTRILHQNSFDLCDTLADQLQGQKTAIKYRITNQEIVHQLIYSNKFIFQWNKLRWFLHFMNYISLLQKNMSHRFTFRGDCRPARQFYWELYSKLAHQTKYLHYPSSKLDKTFLQFWIRQVYLNEDHLIMRNSWDPLFFT